MNELHAKFKDRGLSVLGVTGESANETRPWVESHEMAYPYAYDVGLVSMQYFGRRSFPSAVLIDAQGKVVWKGHPSELEEEKILAAIEGALPEPVFAAEGWSAVRDQLDDQQYARAYAGADAVEDEAERGRLRRGIDLILGRHMQDLRDLWDAGDYLAVQERCDGLKRRLTDLPEEEVLDGYVSDLRGDREIREILRAQEKVRKLMPEEGEHLKSKQRMDRVADLKKLAERYPGTVVERDVDEAIARISGY